VIVLSASAAEEKTTEKQARALENKANKRKLESCLTLVRSLYGKEEVQLTILEILTLYTEKHSGICDWSSYYY